MSGAWLLPRVYALAVLAFLVLPLLLCVLFSFTTGNSAAFPIPSLGLGWYGRLAESPQFRAAAWTTAQITLGCGTAATAIGLATALGLERLSRRAAVLILLTLCLPLMAPPLVLGLSLLTFFNFIGLKLGVTATVLAHLLFTLPIVTSVLYARLSTMDKAALEAARDLGASPGRAFVTVTLPVIGPSLIGCMLIAMALSLDDFVIAFFTTGSNTLSTLIWGMMRTTLNPGINAVGSCIIAISVVITAVAFKFTRYRG
ncbi:ABC transporter permease [Hansschlegelia plantiphila]|uniref:Polyamine transporter PotC n=1 Tax=Hansschlegelia plantiphila TaxID=374655 RepID=A0A9W6MWP7_9HYPH|nr:ABC transporter permease [Hansschlegelia plantiphila]GLK69042.1 polyamine transporter PotC [Hansschlegelia plantiphila]